MPEMRRLRDSELGASEDLVSLLQQISATRPAPILARQQATLSVRFALDICNTPDPLFTGVPRMMPNLPVLKQPCRSVNAAAGLLSNRAYFEIF